MTTCRYLGTAFTLAMLAVSGGCFRSEFIYVDPDGNEIHSSEYKVNVQLASALAPLEESNPQIGHWTGPSRALTRGEAIQFVLNGQTEHGENFSRTIWVTRKNTEGLSRVPSSGPVSFSIKGGPGALRFDGNIKDRQAEGNVSLNVDPAYRKEMAEMTGTNLTPLKAIDLILQDLPIAYVRAFREAGYKFDLDELVRLHRVGIMTDESAELRRGGYEFSADDLVRLKRAGVDASYAIQIRTGGMIFSAEQLAQLKRAGVEPQFAVQLYKTGLAKSADDIVQLRRAGVDWEFVKALASAGYTFTPDDVVKLRRGGIDGEFASGMRKAGYEFTADDLVRLRRGGVDVEYASAALGTSKSRMTADEIVSLKRRGIDAETLRKIRN